MDQSGPSYTESKKLITAIMVLPEKEVLGFPIKYIIFAHGNASDINTMFDYIKILANETRCRVVIFDYPGYGCSDGSATEDGCCQAMDATVNQVMTRFNVSEKDIYLFGQSLGTGVVIDYAYRHKWKNNIVLISPYKSIMRVVTGSSMLRPFDRFCSINKIDKLTCAVKIFHGIDDIIIDVSHSKELYDKLFNKKFQPTYLLNTGHNNILSNIDTADLLEVIYDK